MSSSTTPLSFSWMMDENLIEPGRSLLTAASSSDGDQTAIRRYAEETDEMQSEQRALYGALQLARAALAARTGDMSLLKKLVDSEAVDIANVDTLDHAKRSPLHRACEGGHLDIVKWMIEILHVPKQPLDEFGSTPLHWAARFGHLSICEYLVMKCGADLMHTNQNELMPFEEAEMNGHSTTAEFIKETTDGRQLSEQETSRIRIMEMEMQAQRVTALRNLTQRVSTATTAADIAAQDDIKHQDDQQHAIRDDDGTSAAAAASIAALALANLPALPE